MKKKLFNLFVICLLFGLLLAPSVLAEELSTDATQNVKYQTHVQNEGWQAWKFDGDMSGTSGKSYRLEGIRIETGIPNLGIEYQTHIQNIGWESETGRGWKSNGDMSGTEGLSYRLEAIRIRLTGTDAANYDVWYRVHAQNVGWMGWAKNGADSGTAGYGYRLEGIEIVVALKDAGTPGATNNCFLDANAPAPTTGQINALNKANAYLSVTSFSYSGLISQLKYSGFTNDEATYAADNCGANWSEQGLKKAKAYLDISAFSYTGLVGQLEYDGFTNAQAIYGSDNCGADWNEQAAKKAQAYLDLTSFSRSALINQLIYDGFTADQAEYGVSAVGY